jgi:non-ribosomal peptide synthetase component F
VAGLLAILKAGGAFVPLDPAYPAERLRFMIADAGVACVVTDRSTAEALSEVLAGHHLGMRELAASCPRLPDTLIRQLPDRF